MHGTEKEGQFYFINDNSYISSRELFEMVNSKFKDKDLLPKGSYVSKI